MQQITGALIFRALFFYLHWKEHLSFLTPDIRGCCQKGVWISQSLEHFSKELAGSFLEEFIKKYGGLPFIESIKINDYHGGIFIISVMFFNGTQDKEWINIFPQYYYGFQVSVYSSHYPAA